MNRFLGTSYFGLQTEPAYLEMVYRCMQEFGVSNPISRLSDEDFQVLEEAEREIAAAFECEDACLFTSGYLAGVAAVRFVRQLCVENKWAVAEATTCHPCISIHAPCSKLQQFDDGALACLRRWRDSGEINGWCVLCNSIDSFFGHPDPSFDSAVSRSAQLHIVDVSHSAYIWNHELLRGSDQRHGGDIIYVGSLNKAAAFPAGFIASSKGMVELARCRPEYTSSSAVSRAHAAAFCRAAELRNDRLSMLRGLMVEADQLFDVERGPWSFPIYHLGVDCDDVYNRLCDHNLQLSYLPYPLPDSEKHLRFVLNSSHRAQDVTEAIRRLCEMGVAVTGQNKSTRWKVSNPASQEAGVPNV